MYVIKVVWSTEDLTWHFITNYIRTAQHLQHSSDKVAKLLKDRYNVRWCMCAQ